MSVVSRSAARCYLVCLLGRAFGCVGWGGERRRSGFLSLFCSGSNVAHKTPALISPAPISPFSLPAPASGEVCIHLAPNRIMLLCNWFICSEGRWQCFGNESLGNRRPRIQPTACVNFITSVQMNLKGQLCACSEGTESIGLIDVSVCLCVFFLLPRPTGCVCLLYAAFYECVSVLWSVLGRWERSMWHTCQSLDVFTHEWRYDNDDPTGTQAKPGRSIPHCVKGQIQSVRLNNILIC